MANDILHALIRANLAGTAAALVLLATRNQLRRLIGPNAVYALWLSVPAAGLASLLPSRTVTTVLHTALRDPSTAVAASKAPSAGLDWPSILTLIWAVGALIATAVMVWRHFRFLAAIGRLEESDGVVRAATSNAGPAVIGLIAPRILVPGDFEARFSPRERSVILAHERIHLARGDSRINAAVLILQCLCWFNPVAHIAGRALRLDQELACDAGVMAQFPLARRSYAEAMLKSQTDSITLPAGSYWQAKGASALSNRLALLKAEPLSRGQVTTGLVIALLITSGAGIAGWAAQPARQRLIIQPVSQTSVTALPGVATAPQSLPAAAPSHRTAAVQPSVQPNDREDTTWLPLPRNREPARAILWNSMPMPPDPEDANPSDGGSGAAQSDGVVTEQVASGYQAQTVGTYRSGDYRLKSDFTLVGDQVEVSTRFYKGDELIASGAGTAARGHLAWIVLTNGQIAQVAPGQTAYIMTRVTPT